MREMQLLDAGEMALILKRIAAQIQEQNRAIEGLAVVGIKRGGDHIARRIAQLIGTERIGAIDITLYRDDLQSIPVGKMPQVHSTELPFDVDGASVLLVDDVLYTGRTVRAAIDVLFDFGRPNRVQLAVLVDRGGRELPVAADYVGHNQPVMPPSTVVVRLREDGEEDGVFLVSADQ